MIKMSCRTAHRLLRKSTGHGDVKYQDAKVSRCNFFLYDSNYSMFSIRGLEIKISMVVANSSHVQIGLFYILNEGSQKLA